MLRAGASLSVMRVSSLLPEEEPGGKSGASQSWQLRGWGAGGERGCGGWGGRCGRDQKVWREVCGGEGLEA